MTNFLFEKKCKTLGTIVCNKKNRKKTIDVNYNYSKKNRDIQKLNF